MTPLAGNLLDYRTKMVNDVIGKVWACDTLEKAVSYIEDAANPIYLENFVANKHITAAQSTSVYIDTFNPKTGKVIGKIPCTPAEDVENAVRAAKDAFPAWSKTTRAERSRYLRRISELIQENRELFAVWESIDQGKTVERARIEVDRAISNFS